MAAPVSVVFGHFAGAQASLGVSQSGFDALVKLVRSGKAYVNISGVLSLFKSSAEYRCRTACVGTDSC
jgi:predicted TIM-barrel fold metal-dependent hydrolase